jgi:ComF family protein
VQRLFSQSCVLCGDHAGAEQLCAPCRADLPFHAPVSCPICALPTAGGETCGACLKKPPAFDRTLAAFSYLFPIDAVIHAYKYGGNLALLDLLAQPLIDLAIAHKKPDLLIPMPLHPARLKKRGFNQALEIAKRVSSQLAIPLDAHACRRLHDTPPQATLKPKERAGNLRGAFACDIDLSGKHVALIDDVMTTGASLDELGKAVRAKGAAHVSAWVTARTLPH